jgi:hypothetical protein
MMFLLKEGWLVGWLVFGFMAAAARANLPDLFGWILFNFYFWGK